ncbi:MAG: pyrroloquinoline quinone biosynthesis protein PqqB, partial [Aureispira sp.]
MSRIFALLITSFVLACQPATTNTTTPKEKQPYLIVLGNVQDAGYPQIGCMKACCKEHWHPNAQKKSITALGIVDPSSNQTWLFEASPDFKHQTKVLSNQLDAHQFQLPSGIFLTHGHIGHYVGLMHLGREAMGA